jgi:hypothetical protein
VRALILAASILVHLTGPAAGAPSGKCFLRIAGTIAGGGSSVYCLKTFTGQPGPGATVKDAGLFTFSLPRGRVVARVEIVQRYAADGKHARQTLTGTVVGGTRAYRTARGTVAGGGTDVEDGPGHITSSDLRYRISLTG